MVKSIRTILLPFLIINYVCGLRIIEFPAGHPRPWFSFLYIILLWIAYYYIAITTFHLDVFFCPLYMPHYVCFLLSNSIPLLSIIIGICYDKKFRHCLKKLDIVNVTLEKLGTTITYRKQHTVWLVVIWIVTVIVIDYMHVVFLQYQHNISLIIYISVVINHSCHVTFIDDLTIAIIFGCIGLKFDQINKHLQNLASNNRQVINAWENTLSDSRQCILPKIPSNKRIIWTIMHLHLELCKISREINSIFGIQMTLKMGCYFCLMAMNLHEFFNIIFIKNYIVDNNNIFTCIQINWFVYNVLKLLLINYMCERLSTKANVTKTFADKVLNSTCNVEINENISQFLLQMTQSPLRFYGLGLFQFGFKFLHGFITSIMTVVVILIQAHTNK